MSQLLIRSPIDESRRLVRDKKHREAEKVLLEARHGLPIAFNTYLEHVQLVRELFDLYLEYGRWETADGIIQETVDAFPDLPHPLFKVSKDQKNVYLREHLLTCSQNSKYVLMALDTFPANSNVCVKIDPFGFGAELICYKSAKSKAKCVEHDDDSLALVHNILMTHTKIKVLYF